MRRPLYGDRAVPETDVSLGPTVALAALALAAFIAYAFPLAAAAGAGAAVALVARRLAARLRTPGPAGARALCLPGTRVCVER